MKLAVPVWRQRVSPVFDVCGRLLVVDLDDAGELRRSELSVDEEDPAGRARRLQELGIQVLICGAISRPLEAMLVRSGIRVIGQTCGDVDQVLQAFQAGRLADPCFAMPGCCRRRRGACQAHRRGRSPWNNQET
ncbi:MAG: NifB/NifX family molybdenum-iron cluster-binding protein [Thermoguttaceae bacterium]